MSGQKPKKEPFEFRTLGLGKEFANAVLQLDSISQIRKQLEEEEKELRTKIRDTIAEKGAEAVICGDLRVSFVSGCSASRIDQKLLLEAGVKATVIKKCTIPGKSYETVQITRSKGE
jgi:hypothetical protein